MQVYNEINANIPKGGAVSVGFFDGVHLGHKYLLETLLNLSQKHDIPAVLITLWPHPQTIITGKRIELLTSLQEKICLIESYGIKHFLVLNFDKSLASLKYNEFVNQYLVNDLGAKVLLKGFNNSFGNKQHQIQQKYSTEIEIVTADKFLIDGKQSVNSTKIRNLIMQGEIVKANSFLGYNYRISGNVTKGFQVGRKIGFPTANIKKVNDDKLVPCNGVYIVNVYLKGRKFNAMLNIGQRPTFGEFEQTIEFHILNFDSEIYDEVVEIEFLKKIRNEKKFSNVDELTSQLIIDKSETISYFKNN